MKYISLFEKFDNKDISAIIKFLKSKKISEKGLINDIKSFCQKYNLTLSSINTMQYMKISDARKIYGNVSNNSYYDYAVTFMFSMDSYIGYSLIKSNDYPEIKYQLNKPYNKYITKGKGRFELSNDIKDDDIVLYFFGHNLFFVGSIKTIDGKRYLYQNQIGDYVDEDDLHVLEFNKRILVDENNNKLLKYFKDDKEIRIESCNCYFNIVDNSKLYLYDKADYALVLFLDDAIANYSNLENIQRFRSSNKESAYALKSDKEIRESNLSKYYDSIFSDFNLNEFGVIKNINKLINNMIGSKIFMFTIFKTNFFKNSISSLCNNIYSIIKNDHRGNYSQVIKNDYVESVDYVSSNIKILKKCENKLKGNKKIAYDILNNMSLYIYDKINVMEIENLDDIKLIYYKINLIDNLIFDDQVLDKLSQKTIIFIELMSFGEVYDDGDISNEDINKLKKINNRLKKIF